MMIWNLQLILLDKQLTCRPMFKLLRQDKLQKTLLKGGNNLGKEFVLYCHEQTSPYHWMSLLHEIEMQLRKANVRPGHQPPQGDRLVPGSLYMGYRNDAGKDGEYLFAENNYNPGAWFDHYRDFCIDDTPVFLMKYNSDVSVLREQSEPQPQSRSHSCPMDLQ